MKFFSLSLLSAGATIVSALPAVVLDGAFDGQTLFMRNGGAGGFQDYVIKPGPTGVALAGALNEIPGYGVSSRPHVSVVTSARL